MKQDLLLEIGTEEIPARFIPGALEAMMGLAKERFQQSRLQCQEIKTVGTPRRLALLVFGIPAFQADKEENIIGPPKTAAFSVDGQPTKIALGFTKAKGVGIEELQCIDTPKGTYLGIKKVTKGLPTAIVLSEILPQLVTDLPFPKFMRWGNSSFRFARPIHWIVALLGEEVVPFSLERVVSGNHTFGHRFMSPQAIFIKSLADYKSRLREAWVIVDPEERKVLLQEAIETQAVKAGGEVITDPELLEEVNFLVEFPEPVSGGFDPQFLKLPTEVLITSMKEHQRYFPIIDSQGNLLPSFIAVNNTRVKDIQRVIKGHEKVLRSRLWDAQFFFQEDLKKPLAEKVDALKKVVFHSNLGTSFEKVERIIELAAYLCTKLAPEEESLVRRCALLCKADLTSLMVGEFPTLQGIMGREYAIRSGEKEEIAQGIMEHYLPVAAGSRLPKTTTGALVGLADRLDTLVGFFGLGQIPTGSADPYALRRQAQAVILIIWGKGYSFSLNEILEKTLLLYKGMFTADAGAIKQKLLSFFSLRLQHLLEGEGIDRETIEAVLATEWDDFCEMRIRILALHEFQKHPDFPSLAIGCKRALNILKGITPSLAEKVAPELLIEIQEKALFQQVQEKQVDMERLFQKKSYTEYLLYLAQLRLTIDAFFDQVLVMAPEERTRNNRLALLFQLTALFNRFALFSKFDYSLLKIV